MLNQQNILNQIADIDKEIAKLTLLKEQLTKNFNDRTSLQFPKVNKSIQKIVIIGGQGKFGKLFAKYLTNSGYHVVSLDKNDWNKVEIIMQNTDAVIIAVPINKTEEILEQLQPFLAINMLLIDLTSIKRIPINKMLEVHDGAVLGLHPMFGADSDIAKQVIVSCHGRYAEKYSWFLEQLIAWDAKIIGISAIEHDRYMSYIQALRHFTTFVYGVYLSEKNIDLDLMLELSSPIYRLELIMVGRLFAQNAELYSDIIMSSHDNEIIIAELLKKYKELFNIIHEKDTKKFIKTFETTTKWFQHYAFDFLHESKILLDKL